MARLRPPCRKRLLTAAVILGAAVAGAAILHVLVHGSAICDYRGLLPARRRCLHLPRAGWVDPAALGILLFGVVAFAAVLLTAGRRLPRPSRRVVATLVLGAALVGAATLYVAGVPGGHADCKTNFSGVDQAPPCVRVPGPGWVEPTVLGIVLFGLFAACGVLVTSRRRNPA